MIAINKVPHKLTGDESLIEASFVMQEKVSDEFAIFNINISYIDGFSMPIKCFCDQGDEFLTGCEGQLWKLGTCPSGFDNGEGSCRNPVQVEQ